MNKQKQVRRIFDSISYRYDFLNHLLSGGVDFYWRKKALKLSNISKDSILLDVACGTGDFAIAAKKMGVNKIIGADLSLNMLKLFTKKSDWIKGNLVETVAEEIPFKENSFTNITVAFGVRNFYNLLEGFKSFHRILKKNGKATILEFRLPSNSLVKWVYLFYFKNILPFVGNLISKDKEAYTYLPESVDEFDAKIDLKKYLLDAGFSKVTIKQATFGIVQIAIAEK
ncbi:MAG: bifunctional demethylmenaquinone methyltransferase/2-methoxy-6-polyprenyl-1,4-benzoquinol methylase UbiE [Bacteroidetes bacterium]|nr:bifunctional demethylmenaquinone methyltransferase/2-methoxy-6-polyprenyl-1,4-benzoquinol methylase UbiE [Bacteroidota bacterium]MBU1113558.1 bifunctional demethylmenaquinone methyltransferase/2-methoxy-6-polyprenyl-1,4-benzoquinol methylase UbiE [Bacteroidota bacterium]MBU1800280.1 bifunctional demethylmenaquinone methyltransferase/2-methoxy-6-polyprenyl-1,4-benzoquinol methylase UbiE [Bacteroidota bacterium]